MKKIFIAFNFIIYFGFLQAQLINENFQSGMPVNWTQFSNDGFTWISDLTLGPNVSPCALVDESSGSQSGTAWLQTPSVNLTTLTNPEITFSTALVQNNFVAPNISLWYDIGGGWQFLSDWGGSTAQNQITTTSDLAPPLDASNVTWVDLNFDLSALSTNNNIRFSFGSDISNGGWVLLDNVVIQAQAPPTVYTLPYLQDFEGSEFLPVDWEAFGANTNAEWEHSTTVGAYSASNGSAYFDNFTQNVGGSFYGMRSVLLDLTDAIEPTLTFDVAYAKRNATTSDRLGIWYSLNGVTGWTNVANYEDLTLATAPNQNIYFTPTATQWDSITLDLSSFAGTSLIRFAFENNSSNGNVVYIDNVHFYDEAIEDTVTETSIKQDYLSENLFTVFPNPITDKFIIKSITNTKIDRINLFDIHGKLVKSVLIEEHKDMYELNTTELKKGIYFVRIEDKMNKVSQKIITII